MSTSTTRWGSLALLLLALGLVAAPAQAQRTVTLRLNAATIPDTVTTTGFFEVRGQVDGTAPATLPDGNTIDWSDASTIEPVNVGGDYWETSFQIPDDQELQFKFWSGDAEAIGLNGGWETNADNWTVPAGTGDTTLVLHYYAPDGQNTYDWQPWADKPDTVAVWYRVYMATEEAVSQGYIAGADGQSVGVRGSNLDPDGDGPAEAVGPLDWGSTQLTLTQESDDPDATGFFLYSGVAYYPASAAGTEQPYKFYLEGVNTGWEDGIGDRTFTIPSQDTTLHWVLFDDSAPAEVPTTDTRVTAFVTFTVDVIPLEEAGLFSIADGDSIQVRGQFNGWDDSDPDDSKLRQTVLEPAIWTNEIAVTDTLDARIQYKYYVDQELEEGETSTVNWEEPLDFGGGNRFFDFDGQDITLQQDGFNNIRTNNVIPDGTSIDVMFQVDMRPAADFTTPFDASTQGVRISFEDGIWEGTQARNKGLTSDDVQYLDLADDDSDGIYTGMLTVVGPTYNGIGYRVQYGSDENGWTDEVGDREGEAGRRRYQYIIPSANATDTDPPQYAATYTLPVVPVTDTFPLPFECNPTADTSTLPASVTDVCYEAGLTPSSVEAVGGDLPERIALSGNVPNPFAGTTRFQYTLPETQRVRVRVYDLMGRAVATLVDAVQAANTYEVTFDAGRLASGVYLYRLETATQVETRKMLLVR